MHEHLPTLLRIIGAAQLLILIASALVPSQLNWSECLRPLPKLQRQMYWTYGGYVVMGIIALGLISLFCADELTTGTRLARGLCLYGATFWGVRLCLQPIFDARPYLTKWWLRASYHLLTVLFCSFTVVYLAALFA